MRDVVEMILGDDLETHVALAIFTALGPKWAEAIDIGLINKAAKEAILVYDERIGRELRDENEKLRAAVDLVLVYDETEGEDDIAMMLNYANAIKACKECRIAALGGENG